jgi:hypothetical protein
MFYVFGVTFEIRALGEFLSRGQASCALILCRSDKEQNTREAKKYSKIYDENIQTWISIKLTSKRDSRYFKLGSKLLVP